MKKKNFLCCLLGLTLFICTSCKPSNPRISTTVYPIQYLVERIGGSYVNVELISKDGAIQTTSVKENYEEKNQCQFIRDGQWQPSAAF